jgi:hypothetical protein
MSLERIWIEPPKGVGPTVEAVHWAAIEVDSAEKLSREESPRVMRRRVGVVKRKTIEVNVTIFLQ